MAIKQKELAKELEISDRIDQTAPRRGYITIKDHKAKSDEETAEVEKEATAGTEIKKERKIMITKEETGSMRM